jgi:C4-dicarboxylate transporter DctM subunit
MIAVLFLSFLVLLLLETPIAFAMGVSSLIALLFHPNLPLTLMISRMFVGVDSFPLMAIPFYILAGELMEKGGISERLVRFSTSLVGHLRGGLAMVAVLASMIFAGISGSAAADASAIGSIMVPAMIKKGYRRDFVVSIQASAAAIGPIIPPSILMIIYGSISGVSIGAMFMGGFIPGILIGLALMVGIHLFAKSQGYAGETRATLFQVGRSFRDAVTALVLPLIIIGGILSGIFTATEAGVVAAVYAFLVSFLIYRELRLSMLRQILVSSALTSAMVMLIVSCSSIFGWLLAREGFPEMAVSALLSISDNPSVVLFLVLIFLLLLGCFIEIVAATIILVPVLAPIAAQFGFDPIHYAVIIVIALVVGGVTPPVGILLYITSGLAKVKLSEVTRTVWPFVAIMVGILLLAAYIPNMVLFIPNLFFKR